MTKNKDSQKLEKPAQIPLLEDVIYNTSLPFAPQAKIKQPSQELDASHAPRVTDLFGGSPETAISGPTEYDAEIEGVKDAVVNENAEDESSKIKQHTSQMIDSLVQEYSEEILRRLRDELSLILHDLDLDLDPKSKPPTNHSGSKG